MDFDEVFFDEKNTVILDRLIATARVDDVAKGSPVFGNWREPARKILKRRVEKEEKLAVLKSVRFGDWKFIINDNQLGNLENVKINDTTNTVPISEK